MEQKHNVEPCSPRELKKEWPHSIIIDPEIKEFDPNGLFVVCKICPDATIIRTKQGRTYDASHWKEHVVTQKHFKHQSTKSSILLPSNLTKIKHQTCQGAMPDKQGLVHLFSQYGQVNYDLMYFVIENGQTKLYSRNCTREIILNRSRKKYSSFHACKMCKLLHDDKNLARKILKMRNVERAINIKSLQEVTPDDLAFLKNFVRDSNPSEKKIILQTEIKHVIGYLQRFGKKINASLNETSIVQGQSSSSDNMKLPSEEKLLINKHSPQPATRFSTASMSPLVESSKADEFVSVKKSQLDQITARLDVLEKKFQSSP